MPECCHERNGEGQPRYPCPLDAIIPQRPLYWEHPFGGYELKPQWGDNPEEVAARKANWNKALDLVGDSVVLATKEGPVQTLARKGYEPLAVPEAVVRAAEEYDCATPSKILTADELDGRESFDPTPDAVAALDWAWEQIVTAGMDGGKAKPEFAAFAKSWMVGPWSLDSFGTAWSTSTKTWRTGKVSNCGRRSWKKWPIT